MTSTQYDETIFSPLMIHGISVPISKSDVSPIIWESIVSGQYEAKEVRSVRTLLRPGDRVLELGSGLGIITTVMAQTPDVQIWSFDANPHVINLARKTAEVNGVQNTKFEHGLLTASETTDHTFYIRQDFWMSSLLENQGPYETTISITSSNIDEFISEKAVNVLVMDIEGAERELLSAACLNGVDRVFLELHDHLYGLAGVRNIFVAMDKLGFSYDPRGSVGPCVLFQRDDGQIRSYFNSE